MKKLIGKIIAGALGVTLALMLLGWLAFVPSAREPGAEFVMAWGGFGNGPGQFSDPTGIAVSGSEVFVADSRNGRIQVFDLNGQFLRSFGQPGEALGDLGRPMNLTIFNNELYVPEYFNDRIQVFGLDGTPKRIIGKPGSGPGEFSAPGGVAVAADGSIYVADFHNQRVQKLKADGSFVRQWGTTGVKKPWAGEFNYPTDVTVSDQGWVYVADGYNDRVQVFKPDGSFSHKWGGPFAMNIHGPFNGWFATVTSVTIGPKGNIFAVDFYHHRVQKFKPDGTFLSSFGVKGDGQGQLNFPIAAAITKDGTIFVADYANNRIVKWRLRLAPSGLPGDRTLPSK